MTVAELIVRLKGMDTNANVVIAFDSGLRMNAEVVATTQIATEDNPRGTVVITSNDELPFLADYDLKVV